MADEQGEVVVPRPARARPASREGRREEQGRTDLLIRRSEAARARARRTVGRSQELHTVATAMLRSTQAAVLAARLWGCYALVEATLDGAPTSAIVRRDGSVVVDRRLRTRLDIVRALGDTLATGRLAVVGRDPLTSLLTIVRSCDGVRSVNFVEGPSAAGTGRPSGAWHGADAVPPGG